MTNDEIQKIRDEAKRLRSYSKESLREEHWRRTLGVYDVSRMGHDTLTKSELIMHALRAKYGPSDVSEACADKMNADPYRIWLVNFGYYLQAEGATLEEAKQIARQAGFDARIDHGEQMVGCWSIIGGWRSYC